METTEEMRTILRDVLVKAACSTLDSHALQLIQLRAYGFRNGENN